MVTGRGDGKDRMMRNQKDSPKLTCALDGRLLASTTRGSHGWSMKNPVMANLNRGMNIRYLTMICSAMSVAFDGRNTDTCRSNLAFKTLSIHDELTGREQKACSC